MSPNPPRARPDPLQAARCVRIGVFDSGLGGLSVLRAIRQHLPSSPLTYVADSGYAPYGERDEAFIAARSFHISAFLVERGAQALVVACNTATAAAVHALRARWPQLPIIGVEPGVKPAVACSRNKRIGVLATPGTLASAKFRRLIEAHGQHAVIVPQPCAGLAREIECGQLDTPSLRDLVMRFARPLRDAQVDTVVLGCTHYPFVTSLFQEALGPHVHIIDTADAVARHTERLCAQLQPASPEKADAADEFWTSGQADHLSQVALTWLGVTTRARALPERL